MYIGNLQSITLSLILSSSATKQPWRNLALWIYTIVSADFSTYKDHEGLQPQCDTSMPPQSTPDEIHQNWFIPNNAKDKS